MNTCSYCNVHWVNELPENIKILDWVQCVYCGGLYEIMLVNGTLTPVPAVYEKVVSFFKNTPYSLWPKDCRHDSKTN